MYIDAIKAMKFNALTLSVCIYREKDLNPGLIILKTLDVNWKNNFSEKGGKGTTL